MKRKNWFDRIRNFLSSILVIMNGLVLFLAPLAKSVFRGSISGRETDIDFTVGIFGNWVEYHIYYGFSEGSFTGVASDIGTYIPAIIPLVSVALVLSFFGMIFVWSQFDWRGKDKTLEERVKIERLYRTIGSVVSILGGILGVVSLILFAVFVSTVVQPYDHFPFSNTPRVHLSFWFYFSLLCFLVYLSLGIYTLVKFYRKPKLEVTPEEIDEVEESSLDLNHYARLIVFDERMKDYDTVFHTEFTAALTEDHLLNLFQEISFLLTSADASVNTLPIISHVITCLGIEAVLPQLDWLVSQIKELDTKKTAELLVALLHHEGESSVG